LGAKELDTRLRVCALSLWRKKESVRVKVRLDLERTLHIGLEYSANNNNNKHTCFHSADTLLFFSHLLQIPMLGKMGARFWIAKNHLP
jgi:hypothetical protein